MSEMHRIDETISTTSTKSREISGTGLSQVGSQAQATLITAQVIPSPADGDFEVEIQGAINSPDGKRTFTSIGSWDQHDEALLSVLPISLNCSYRFIHVSGVACRVLLTG